ncbi:maestro heat-like repeat-containing protein family member 7 [Zootoca vivipara]|uniref:maestro heat-like repeat-containing protein family member 7 n=1 Tax=Zootoca vivipara TaxID=8524 RepID=UPI00293BE09C|nr:maestro heat-like repeat-containing protein family member 7 [Zootoca vivipara]
MASPRPLEGIDFDEDQISVISLEDEEDLYASISTTGSLGAADPPPDGFRKDQLKARLMDVVTRMKSGKIRRKALQDLSALLQKIQEYPSVALPASPLGQLVAISCLCALDPDPECRQQAAEALCHLLPILRRKEETLAQTSWNQTLILRAQKVLQSTGGPVPELFVNDCYSLARVYGAYLPAEQLLEAMCFLASDLVVESSFNPLDISHLLQEFIKQFSGTKVEVEVLLEAFYKITQGPTVQGRNMAAFALSIMPHQHLAKVVAYLLQFPFRDCERVWKEVLASADQEQLLHLMAEQLYQSPLAESATQVQHLTSLLHAILRMEVYKAAVRRNFPQLLIALLGMVVNFHYDQEFLGGAKEVLHLLLGTTGEQVEAAIVDQLFCRENFSQGLAAMVRAVGKRHWWIPPMVENITAALEDQEFAGMPQVAAAIYIELLSCRLQVYPCEDTLEQLLTWLKHDHLQVRKLSVRGISLLLDSDMDPSLLRLSLLDFLPDAEADVFPELIELVHQAYLSKELGEEDLKMLAATYCGLAAHEEASVRASAIQHLGLLRGWARDKKLPTTTTTEEEAINELVVVLLHLEDEDEVAKAARRALSHLAPQVKWWAHPNKFSLHFALHQAAKHLSKTFSKNILRSAALTCMKPSANRMPAVSRVAALLLGHLAFRDASFIDSQDMASYGTWLEEMQQHEEEGLRRTGRSCLNIMQRACKHRQKGRVQRLVRRLLHCVHREPYPRDFLSCMPEHPQSRQAKGT